MHVGERRRARSGLNFIPEGAILKQLILKANHIGAYEEQDGSAAVSDAQAQLWSVGSRTTNAMTAQTAAAILRQRGDCQTRFL